MYERYNSDPGAKYPINTNCCSKYRKGESKPKGHSPRVMDNDIAMTQTARRGNRVPDALK